MALSHEVTTQVVVGILPELADRVEKLEVIVQAAAIATIADFALAVGLAVREHRQNIEQPRSFSAHIVAAVLLLAGITAVALGVEPGDLVTVLTSIG